MTDARLTKDQIKVLRNADTVAFHRESRDGEVRDYVICTKDHDPGDGFGKRELREEFDVGPAAFEAYELPGGNTPVVWATGLGRKFTPEWATCVAMLREGDELRPRWVLGNNSDTLRKAGLSHDEFKLDVVRGRAGDTRRFTFWLDDVICPTDGCRMATRDAGVFA